MAQGGWGGWNPYFSRAFNDWEVKEVESFLERLHGKRVRGDVEDMVFWTETKSGKFSVKSLYLALEVGCPFCFLLVAFGMCGCNIRLDFLHGRLRGAKP